MKHYSEDYKLTAVKYYLKHNQDMRNTCKISIISKMGKNI